MAKKKKFKVSALSSLLAIVFAIVLIVSCILPYFTYDGLLAKGEINGFSLISALFANTDGDNYEAKGETAGDKLVYGIFASGKKDKEDGGKYAFTSLCPLLFLVFGVFAFLGGANMLLKRVKNALTIERAIFAVALIISIVGIILSYVISKDLSASASILGMKLETSLTVGFGVWLAFIASLLGLGSTFVKLK